MYADLHLHSTFSDGTDTPLELFEIAGKNDIKVIAISDHDSVEGVKSVCNSGFPTDIRLIPAIEVSTICKRRFMHLLGYYIDVYSSDLNSFITEISADKTENTRINFENAKAQGYFSYDWERVLEVNKGQSRISGVHVVKAMRQDNYSLKDMGLREMFHKFFLPQSPFFIETEKTTVYDAVDIVKKAGGVPVIAHPKSIGNDEIVSDLIDYGVKGLEVFHPTHSKEEIEKYGQIAEDKKLYITGGSDWHGGNNDPGTTHMGMTGLSHDGYDILNL